MVQRLLNFVHGPNSIKGATALLAVTLLLSNVLGLIRDHYLAQKIPADILDTYFAAFRLPDLIFNVLILGAVSAAFIPVFTNFLAKDRKDEAFKVASNLLTIAFVAVLVLAAAFYLAMPTFISWLVPDFSAQKIELTIINARLLLLSPIFFGFSFIISGMLNSWKRFVATSLAPLVYNGSIITGTVLLADRYSVTGVVWAVIVGSLLHLVIQIPTLLNLGFRFHLAFDFGSQALRKIGTLMVPRSINLAANQVLLLAFTFIASKIGAGAVAIYNFADNIQTTPVVIFATSLSQALFPTLSEHFALKRDSEFSRHIEKAIGTILVILTPIAVGMVLLRAQLVRLILGSGYFGWEETIEAARTLGWFGLGLVFGGLLPLLQRGFFARHNTLIPMVGGIVAIIVAILTASFLAPAMGVAALAVGFSLGMIVEVVVLYLLLRRTVRIDETNIAKDILRIIAATFVMALAVQAGKIFIGTIFPLTRFVEVLTQLVVATAFGMVVYFPTIKLLGHRGLQGSVKQLLLSKLNGRFLPRT